MNTLYKIVRSLIIEVAWVALYMILMLLVTGISALLLGWLVTQVIDLPAILGVSAGLGTLDTIMIYGLSTLGILIMITSIIGMIVERLAQHR